MANGLTILTRPRWRKLLGDLRAARSRIVLMVLAIVVSLVAVGTVLGAYAILTREIAANYQSTHPADATLELEDGVTAAVVAQVRLRPEIREAEAREVVLARVQVASDWRPLLLFVIADYAQLRLNTFRPETGAWPPPMGTMLLERSALRGVDGKVGSTLTIKTPNGAATNVVVSGVVHDPGLAPAWQERETYGYVTAATLAQWGESGTLHELRVAFVDPEAQLLPIQANAVNLAAALQQEGHVVHQIRIPPPRQHPHQRQMTTLLLMMLAFALLAIVLSAILVATSLAAMLARQVREIGVVKAIGAQSGQIARLYSVLLLALGVTAVALTLPLSVVAAQFLSAQVARLLNFNLADQSLPWWVYLTQAVTGVLVPLLNASAPNRRASRMTIREALDQHGVSSDVLSPRLSRLPYGLRNAFRRPGRLALTLGLLAPGGAMFLTALKVSSGWQRNLTKIEETRFSDLDVRLHAPTATTLVETLRHVPNLRAIEAWGLAPAAFAVPGQVDVVHTYPDRGHGSLSMMAPPPDTQFVRFPLGAGRWLVAGDTDAVVLNHVALAQLPDTAVGSTIAISLDGETSRWRVVGVVEEIGSPGTAYVTDQVFAKVARTIGRTRMLRLAARMTDEKARQEMVRAVERVLIEAAIGVDMLIPMAELRSAIDGHVFLLIQSLVVMAIVLGFVGLLGLGSTMSISVIERTREIGVVAAIGATPDRILRAILSEAFLIAGLSWVLAVPLTAVLDWLIGSLGFLAPLPFVMAGGPMLIWAALLAVVALVATLIPATRASHVTVREALAHL